MNNHRLLIVYAHPDDESFGLGGLITKYVQAGIQVDYVCATNGDVGDISPELIEQYGSKTAVRLAELDCAAQTLGLHSVVRLDYKDSGMMGTATNEDPTCLWQAEPAGVTRRVVEVIRDLRPQVVITFNKYGGYGHPDHIAIQKATTEAFRLAGDSAYSTDQPAYQPQKLYYSSIPKRQIQMGIVLMRLRGENPRQMGRNKDIDVQAIIEHAEPVHTLIDIRDYYDAWDAASNCHQSQLGGRTRRMPPWAQRLLGPKQGFTRIYPVPLTNHPDEDNLFAGVVQPEGVYS